MRTFIAFIKVFLFVSVSIIAIPLQTTIFVFFGKTRFVNFIPNLYGKVVSFILRVKVSTEGAPTKEGNVIYVGNHLSYADIGSIGGSLSASFISKAEVKGWPILGQLAAVSRTVFISRDRNAAVKCIADIKKTLTTGQNLILFPEGTSTNGLEVLPFKSTLFELFLSDELKETLTVQPFTITITGVDGRNIEKPEDNDLYAYYGEDVFFPHLWKLAKSKGASVLLTFHAPRKASDYNDRKKFAADCYNDVAGGLKNTLPETLDFTGKAA